MRSYRALMASFVGTIAVGVAQPQTALLALDLQERCRAYIEEPHSSDGAFCLAYVQGFLDGATSIDPRVRPAHETAPESWIERAQRTRLGPRQLSAPAYCI